MEARVVDKRKLPSRHVTEGPEHAPHRSYYYAMGLSPQQIHQPFVGVASCWNEAGGIPMAMKTLLAAGYLHGDCMTVTGRTIAENLKNVKWNSNQDVVYEATEGGPIGLIRGGDIDTTTGLLSVRLDDAILAARKREWKPRENAYKSGAIWKYAQGVGSARKGAVTYPGGAADATTYADI